MKLLLDTCVLIDYFSRREPYFSACIKLRIMQAMGDAELWVSAKSFTDIFYVLRKAVEPPALQAAFIQSLDFLNICSVHGQDIHDAAQLAWLDFEDCLIEVCAQKIKADYILTRDTKGFDRATTCIMTPADFLRKAEKEFALSYEEMAI